MHETTKCDVINNFNFHKSFLDACFECFQLATDYPYTIALKIMVLYCRTARQSLKWAMKLRYATDTGAGFHSYIQIDKFFLHTFQ